jgi:regulator of protease activity HflC (stomatin/prohibitin superfamily)
MSRTVSAVGEATALALRAVTVLLMVGAVVWLFSGLRRVEPGTWAVVTRFGAVVRDQGPGLLFAWPRPVEETVLISGPQRQLSLAVTHLVTSPPEGDQRQGGFVLSGDGGMAEVGITVLYRVADPQRYAVVLPQVEVALRRAAGDAVIAACAQRPLDGLVAASLHGTPADAEVGVGNRERLRQEVATRLARTAEAIGLGVEISRVDLHLAVPVGAREAFAAVVTAEATAATDVASARTEAERVRQDAGTQAERLRVEAQARAREMLRDAQVIADRVHAYRQAAAGGAAARDLLLTRVWRERLDMLMRRAGTVTAVAPEAPPTALPAGLP